jgi:cell division protein ZapA (FtsZ GTPase activity inhibitor)
LYGPNYDDLDKLVMDCEDKEDPFLRDYHKFMADQERQEQARIDQAREESRLFKLTSGQATGGSK